MFSDILYNCFLVIKSEEKLFMVPKEKLKGSCCCGYCCSASNDSTALSH